MRNMNPISSDKYSVLSPGRMSHNTLVSLLFPAILLVGMLTTLSAQPVAVGLPAVSGTGNCIPFGCPNLLGLTEFQQVYASTSFPNSPITINQITFLNTQDFQGAPITPANYQFSLSTTSQAIGGLDPSNLANNVGPDNQIFFSGQLS